MQVVELAGYKGTPAEEMATEVPESAPSPGPIPDAVKPTDEQAAEIHRLLAELATLEPGVDWPARAREIAGVPGHLLTQGGATILIRKLEAALDVVGAAEDPARQSSGSSARRR